MKISKNLKLSFFVVALLWALFFIRSHLPVAHYLQGIQPRRTDALPGILTAPLVHGSLEHLSANSGALFILLFVSLAYSHRLTVSAVSIIVLVGGGLVWLLANSGTLHIGASGVIFGLIGFLMFSGLFRKDWRALIISLLVGVVYGGTLLSLLGYSPGVSWSSHFYGFSAGILAAWVMRRKRR